MTEQVEGHRRTSTMAWGLGDPAAVTQAQTGSEVAGSDRVDRFDGRRRNASGQGSDSGTASQEAQNGTFQIRLEPILEPDRLGDGRPDARQASGPARRRCPADRSR